MPATTNEKAVNGVAAKTKVGEAEIPEKAKGQAAPAKPPANTLEKLPTQKLERLIFRLYRLFRPAEDLGSVLTTFNYSLYLLAYLGNKATGVKSKAISLFRSKDGVEIAEGIAGTDLEISRSHVMKPEPSNLTKFGNLIYTTRATLRLFGLLPIYVKARQLKRDPNGQQDFKFTVDIVQCTLYATFQLLENIAFLMENRILPRRALGRWAGGATGRSEWLYRMAHRAWLMGVMCDFVKLILKAQSHFRKTQIDKVELTREEAEEAAGWYEDWIAPLAWLPIGWKLSAWYDEEVPSFHLGLHGLAGILADLKKTAKLWGDTEKE